VTSENITKVDDLVSNDPHITTTELASQVGISRERITHILRNELDFHKVCAKWVPHKLSEDNKRLRVEVSKQLLETLKEGYNNIITGDETWICSGPNQNLAHSKMVQLPLGPSQNIEMGRPISKCYTDYSCDVRFCHPSQYHLSIWLLFVLMLTWIFP
jgi:hypothetical protein